MVSYGINLQDSNEGQNMPSSSLTTTPGQDYIFDGNSDKNNKMGDNNSLLKLEPHSISDEKINLTLSSGDEVDVYQLPVRVNSEIDERPMVATPGGPEPTPKTNLNANKNCNNFSSQNIAASSLPTEKQKAAYQQQNFADEIYMNNTVDKCVNPLEQHAPKEVAQFQSYLDLSKGHSSQKQFISSKQVCDSLSQWDAVRNLKSSASMTWDDDIVLVQTTKAPITKQQSFDNRAKQINSTKRRDAFKDSQKNANSSTSMMQQSMKQNNRSISKSHSSLFCQTQASNQNNDNLIQKSQRHQASTQQLSTANSKQSFNQKPQKGVTSSSKLNNNQRAPKLVRKTTDTSDKHMVPPQNNNCQPDMKKDQWQRISEPMKFSHAHSAQISPNFNKLKDGGKASPARNTLSARNSELLTISAKKRSITKAKIMNTQKSFDNDKLTDRQKPVQVSGRPKLTKQTAELTLHQKYRNVKRQQSEPLGFSMQKLKRQESCSDSDIFSQEDDEVQRNRIEAKITQDSFKPNMTEIQSEQVSRPQSRSDLPIPSLGIDLQRNSTEALHHKKSAEAIKLSSKTSRKAYGGKSKQGLVQNTLKSNYYGHLDSKNKLQAGASKKSFKHQQPGKTDRQKPTASNIRELLHFGVGAYKMKKQQRSDKKLNKSQKPNIRNEISKQPSISSSYLQLGKQQSITKTTKTSRRTSLGGSFLSQNSEVDLATRVKEATNSIQKRQSATMWSSKQQKQQTIQGDKNTTFEYGLVQTAGKCRQGSEGPIDSGMKSEDIGDISPDKTPGSGVQESATQSMSKVEILDNAVWKIQPFKIAINQVGQPKKQNQVDARKLSPRLDVTKYGTTKPKFKEHINLDQKEESQSHEDKYVASSMINQNQKMQIQVQSMDANKLDAQAPPGSKTYANFLPAQNLSLPTESSQSGSSGKVLKQNKCLENNLRHQRHQSTYSENNIADNSSATLQSTQQPNQSTLRSSVTKRSRVTPNKANRFQSPPPESCLDSERQTKDENNITQSETLIAFSAWETNTNNGQQNQRKSSVHRRNAVVKKNNQSHHSDVPVTDKTITEKYQMASETATIDQFDTNNRLMELSPKGTKLQMEQSIDTLQHTGVENSPRNNFNDDNISENNRKNVTISQRAAAAADEETKKYECPNSVIFQFQTKPKRALQSQSSYISPPKRDLKTTAGKYMSGQKKSLIQYPSTDMLPLTKSLGKWNISKQLLFGGDQEQARQNYFLKDDHPSLVNEQYFLATNKNDRGDSKQKKTTVQISRQRSQQQLYDSNRLRSNIDDSLLNDDPICVFRVESRVMGEAEMPLSHSSPVKSDYQKNKKKQYHHKRDTSIISSLLTSQCDDKLRTVGAAQIGAGAGARRVSGDPVMIATQRISHTKPKFKAARTFEHIRAHSTSQYAAGQGMNSMHSSQYNHELQRKLYHQIKPNQEHDYQHKEERKQTKNVAAYPLQSQQNLVNAGDLKSLLQKRDVSQPRLPIQKSKASRQAKQSDYEQRSYFNQQLLTDTNSHQRSKQNLNDVIGGNFDGEYELLQSYNNEFNNEPTAASQMMQSVTSVQQLNNKITEPATTYDQQQYFTAQVGITDELNQIEVQQNNTKHAAWSKSEVQIPGKAAQVAHKTQAPLPDEFRIYEDKAIHGWLLKQGRGGYISSQWKRLFVIVDQQKIRYFADKSMTTQKGVIDFTAIKARLSVADESTFQITVQVQDDKDKIFTFKTQSTGSLATWITIINLQMNNAEVQPASDMLLQRSNSEALQHAPRNFWKVCQISSDELMRNAQTGDLVLFTGVDMQARLIRGVTGSKYDHVGMLVKYEKSGQVLIFESLAGKGVSRWDWQEYQQNNYWSDNYSKIVYRRLVGVERDEEFRKKVQEFMIETVGKPYRMLRNVLGSQDEQDHLKAKVVAKAGFFCSELVACCLKRLALLDQNVPSTQYWPGQFSTENPSTSVQLLNDCFYSEEITVDVKK